MGGRGTEEAIPGAHTKKFWFDVQPHVMAHDRLTVRSRFLSGHFVIVSCVFIHIAGSISIFNISLAQPPVSEAKVAPTFRSERLDQRAREPSHGGHFANRQSTIVDRQSQISRRLESSILLELTAYSRQPTDGGQLRSAVISLPIARCLRLSAYCLPPFPSLAS